MQSIGYRHIHPVVDGIDTLANALVEMQRDTKRFARRRWLPAVRDPEGMRGRRYSPLFFEKCLYSRSVIQKEKAKTAAGTRIPNTSVPVLIAFSPSRDAFSTIPRRG